MLLRKHRVAADETGASLIVVLGVTAVGLILSALIATSLVSSLGFSSASRAGLQSQAAADAGVAAARAGLNIVNNCATQTAPGRYASADPAYTVTIQYKVASGWQDGCPTAAASQVRILSVGAADAEGVAGYSGGDARTVEAILEWLAPGVAPSGIAMYLYEGGVVEANSTFDFSESSGAGLIVKNGDLDCAKNNSVYNGSIVVNGKLTFSGTCEVTGSAWVSALATLGSATPAIGQDLSAGSVSPNPPGTKVGGTYTQGGALPTIPSWTDVPYAPATWLEPDGTPFQVDTWTTAAQCKLPNGNLGGTGGKGLVVNALGCTGGPTADHNTTVRLTSDVVIYANKFSWDAINSLQFTSSSAATHRIWFITPDGVADNMPTCNTTAATPNTQGNFTIKNGFSIAATLSAFVYTPCAFEGKNGFTWRGQIYSGAYSAVKNNPSIEFVPVGVAGFDLDGGTSVPVITTPKPGQLLSNRNLS